MPAHTLRATGCTVVAGIDEAELGSSLRCFSCVEHLHACGTDVTVWPWEPQPVRTFEMEESEVATEGDTCRVTLLGFLHLGLGPSLSNFRLNVFPVSLGASLPVQNVWVGDASLGQRGHSPSS